MKEAADFFDESYFEKCERAQNHRSNYTRVGGYKAFASTMNWDSIADALLKRIPEPRRYECYILDVGCGYGYLVQALRGRGVYAFGLDISAFAVGMAAPEVRGYLAVGDASFFIPPAPNFESGGSWDLIHSADVLEHCESVQEARLILAKMSGVSIRQLHKVNTGQYENQAFDGDQSHGLRMTLDEWRRMAFVVNPNIVIEE